MSRIDATTNFKYSPGGDLGKNLITKDYLMSVYPSIAEKIGIPPELWIWGRGSNGVLGTNNTSTRITPVTTSAGGTNWKQVSCGYGHVAAIKTDGTLWTWGVNNVAQIGNNVSGSIDTPVTTFAGGTDWKQVSAGNNITAAIKTDGTLWTWGNASNGQLGTNDITPNRSTPVTTFAGGTDWKQVSSGFRFTAAIKTDGTLWTWGLNTYGQLGTNDTTNIITPVTTFAGGTNWKQVSGVGEGLAAIKTDGTLWTWGRNSSGRLGNNDITTRITPVTTFAGGTNWKQVSSSGTVTAAIKTDGTLWTWGNSLQLGTNDIIDRSTPDTTFAGGTNWKQVSAAIGSYVAAIKTDGTLWTWGLGTFGRLGTNDIIDRSTPVTTFAGGTNWKQVSGGNSHASALISTEF